MSGFFDLPPKERAKRYRELADEASRMAAASQERIARQSYLQISERWQKRADAIEQNILKQGTLCAHADAEAAPAAMAAILAPAV